MRLLIAQINPTIGDLEGNLKLILKEIENARKQKAELVIFPELTLTGYPPEDLLLFPEFIQAVEEKLQQIKSHTQDITAVIGLPRANSSGEKRLYNSVAILQNQHLLGYYDKVLLPTYDVFDERRYFDPGETFPLWNIGGLKVAITICEDIWEHCELISYTKYLIDPIKKYKELCPDLLVNISASPFSGNKPTMRMKVFTTAVKSMKCPIAFCNQVGGNDSLIFDGYSFFMNEQGEVLSLAKGFDEDSLFIDSKNQKKQPFIPFNPVEDLFRALILGLKDYFKKQGFQKACFGLSGGIDSSVLACIAKEALGKENVLGVLMPSSFTAKCSVEDAVELSKRLGISYTTLPIHAPYETYLELLKPQFGDIPFGIAEENLQARIRGMLLMALSNKFGYIVLSPGNKSELAMGYATLYGDMCGGLAVLGDVTKMQVYQIADWINREEEIIPKNTIERPPSAELRPNQRDSDSLPEYSIIDNVMKEYLENHLSPKKIVKKYNYDPQIVDWIVHTLHANEYKRRQSAPSLRVSEKAFSVGRRFPIVQKWVL